jgi:quinol monooxygenase YgiN
VSRYGLCGIMKAQPGQREALLEILLQAAGLVADLPGCEVWIVNTMPDDPDGIWVTEVWRSEADHAASLAGDDLEAVITRAIPLIAGFGERFTLQPIAGKGLIDPAQ